ncbi:hypothetical protein Tco_1102610 [Tanacetum coccineum]
MRRGVVYLGNPSLLETPIEVEKEYNPFDVIFQILGESLNKVESDRDNETKVESDMANEIEDDEDLNYVPNDGDE